MRFFRFRVIGFLVLMTIVAGLLAWYVQPRRVTALARLIVQDPSQQARFHHELVDQPANRSLLSRNATLREMVKSKGVLEATLMNPQTQQTLLAGVENPIDWLQQNLTVDFEGESQLLAIRLSAHEGHGKDLVKIVDAVCQAFMEEVVLKNRINRMRLHDEVTQRHRALQDELRKEIASFERLKADNPTDADTLADLRVRKTGIESLREATKELGKRVDLMEIELTGRPEVQLVESAYIAND